MPIPRRPRALIGAGVLALTLAACGGAAGSPAATTATSAATTTGQPAAAASGTAASATTAGAAKVSANNASAAQLQAALEAAGVPNAARWVVEVQEYRPYPADDPTFAKLRGQLAKYNPAAGVVDKIVSALSLP